MPERPSVRQRMENSRARQRAAGVDKLTPEQVQQAFYALLDQLAGHAEQSHQWRKVHPCVWCVTCNVRLYQGELFTAGERAELARYRAWRATGMPEGMAWREVTGDGRT